jgi:hypothetical protein
MQNRQETEDHTCIKLGPDSLGAWRETHQHPSLPASLLYAVAKRGGEAVPGVGGYDIVILGNRRNL